MSTSKTTAPQTPPAMAAIGGLLSDVGADEDASGIADGVLDGPDVLVGSSLTPVALKALNWMF